MNDKLEKVPPQMTEQERRADNRRILRVVSEAAMKHLSGDVGARTAATIELLDDYDALARKVAALVRALEGADCYHERSRAIGGGILHTGWNCSGRQEGVKFDDFPGCANPCARCKALADIEGEGDAG